MIYFPRVYTRVYDINGFYCIRSCNTVFCGWLAVIDQPRKIKCCIHLYRPSKWTFDSPKIRNFKWHNWLLLFWLIDENTRSCLSSCSTIVYTCTINCKERLASVTIWSNNCWVMDTPNPILRWLISHRLVRYAWSSRRL